MISPAEAGEQGIVIWNTILRIPRDQKQQIFCPRYHLRFSPQSFHKNVSLAILSGPNLLDDFLIFRLRYLILSDHFNTFFYFSNKEDSSAPLIVVLGLSSSTGRDLSACTR